MRRPRSVSIPLTIIFRPLIGLTIALAHPGESVQVSITTPAPATTPIPTARGSTIAVEGIANSRDAVYRAIDERASIQIVLFKEDHSVPPRQVDTSSGMA
jgi:hypothetical protein